MADSFDGSGVPMSVFLKPFLTNIENILTPLNAASKTAGADLKEGMIRLNKQTDAQHLMGALGPRMLQLGEVGDSVAADLHAARQHLAEYVAKLTAAKL